MTLRVLLGDESVSIQKVFQLGLQDYGAEVRSVYNGADLIEVAEEFKPHIIFIDILLQKKDGYEISTELSQHPKLKDTPVILMWSSFMELDSEKYKQCGACGEMEKPFEVEKMRSHIEKKIPSIKGPGLSSVLTFPKTLTQGLDQGGSPATPLPPPPPDPPAPNPSPEISPPKLPVSEETLPPSSNKLLDSHSKYLVLNPEDMDIPDSWKVKPLKENSPMSDNQEEKSDNFQAMNLSDLTLSQEKETLSSPKSRHTPPLPSQIEDFLSKQDEPVQTTSKNPLPSPLEEGQMESLILAHTQEFLTLKVQQELPKIMEKVVKDELEKWIQKELELKK